MALGHVIVCGKELSDRRRRKEMTVFNLFTKTLPTKLTGCFTQIFPHNVFTAVGPDNSHKTIHIGRLDFGNKAAQCRLMCRNVHV